MAVLPTRATRRLEQDVLLALADRPRSGTALLMAFRGSVTRPQLQVILARLECQGCVRRLADNWGVGEES